MQNSASSEYLHQISLRLKLRQIHGDEFQEFFSTVMLKLHGDDFIRVRPYGKKGDKGCDGYLSSSGHLFACYGAINGDKSKVKTLIGKMKTDFAKAKKNFSSPMKGWHFVHNLVDGLPVEAVTVLEELKASHPNINFSFIGLEGFESRISKLSNSDADKLLGPRATNEDARNIQVIEIAALIAGVVESVEGAKPSNGPIEPVSEDKLDANALPNSWRQLIENGWKNARFVADYLNAHHDSLLGGHVASILSEKYKYLKSQNIGSASIMDALYEFITGAGTVAPTRQIAAQALLAHLFESCDILENAPVKTKK